MLWKLIANFLFTLRLGCYTFGHIHVHVITVGIGWVLLASATGGFSGYIKLAYCSSAKGLQ